MKLDTSHMMMKGTPQSKVVNELKRISRVECTFCIWRNDPGTGEYLGCGLTDERLSISVHPQECIDRTSCV